MTAMIVRCAFCPNRGAPVFLEISYTYVGNVHVPSSGAISDTRQIWVFLLAYYLLCPFMLWLHNLIRKLLRRGHTTTDEAKKW